MHLTDFVKEEYAAVRLRDGAWLRLRNTCRTHRARALIDRVVHRTEQGVGDCALVKAYACGVHFNKF
ncbi:hypothetical protein SDC9_119859 [bioreactor metagenome]|uniref:Uncharacterized protein n=1 Tax=bioreactor metagenome TaxID=1076179 RepID=A0A645C8Y7_9ZZZZ